MVSGPSSFDFPFKGLASHQGDGGIAIPGLLIDQAQCRAELEADEVTATANALAAKGGIGLAIFQTIFYFQGSLDMRFTKVLAAVV